MLQTKQNKKNQIKTCKIDKKERSLGLDIIRTIAIFFVFITHSITYKSVLSVNPLSIKWTLYMIIRFMAMTSVPLFLLLTGYLNNKKEISKKYYKGIIPLLISYLFISIFEVVGESIYLKTAINWKLEIVNILNFTANGYAWYFEMYIGLFLLIPFLNILYDNLKSKNEKIILVSSLTFLTFIPQVVKSFKLEQVWLNISPDYWQIIYPITYFYIGKLIREYKPKFSILKRILLVIGTLAIPCTFCYIYSTPTEYAWYMFNGFEAMPTALVAVSIFLLFYDFNKKIPVLSKIITEISICSFEMYLFSSIYDQYFYSKYGYNIIIMVCLVAITTYISSRIFISIRDYFLKVLKL